MGCRHIRGSCGLQALPKVMGKAPTRVHMWVSSSFKRQNQSLKVETIHKDDKQQDGDSPQLSATECTTGSALMRKKWAWNG